jgi:hypothetical protein
VGVGRHLGARPSGKLEGHIRQGREGPDLFRREDLGRGATLQGSRGPPPCHLCGPAPRLGDYLLDRGEVPAGVETAADVALNRLDPGLVLRVADPCGVQEAPVVGAELGIGPVELGVADVGLYEPGAEVVEHDASDHAVVEAERLGVCPHPGLLVHHQHRVHEQVAGEAEHHQERPHPAVPTAPRISPGPEVAVVHLGFIPGLHGRAPDDDRSLAHVLGKAGPHLAP